MHLKNIFEWRRTWDYLSHVWRVRSVSNSDKIFCMYTHLYLKSNKFQELYRIRKEEIKEIKCMMDWDNVNVLVR